MSDGVYDPVVGVGLQALSAALKAKSGMLSKNDLIDLLETTLRYRPGDDALREAVLSFTQDSVSDPRGAGGSLHDFLLSCGHPVIEGSAQHPPAAIDTVLYEWQRRADLQ